MMAIFPVDVSAYERGFDLPQVLASFWTSSPSYGILAHLSPLMHFDYGNDGYDDVFGDDDLLYVHSALHRCEASSCDTCGIWFLSCDREASYSLDDDDSRTQVLHLHQAVDQAAAVSSDDLPLPPLAASCSFSAYLTAQSVALEAVLWHPELL